MICILGEKHLVLYYHKSMSVVFRYIQLSINEYHYGQLNVGTGKAANLRTENSQVFGVYHASSLTTFCFLLILSAGSLRILTEIPSVFKVIFHWLYSPASWLTCRSCAYVCILLLKVSTAVTLVCRHVAVSSGLSHSIALTNIKWQLSGWNSHKNIEHTYQYGFFEKL